MRNYRDFISEIQTKWVGVKQKNAWEVFFDTSPLTNTL